MKRKIISPDELKNAVKDYLDGWSMIDIAKKCNSSYDTMRYALKVALNCESPSSYRKQYWEENNYIPIKIRNNDETNNLPKSNKLLSQKCIPVLASLIKDREASHAEIARQRCCSREYVGKVAEASALCGLEVSRLGSSAERTKRGAVS